MDLAFASVRRADQKVGPQNPLVEDQRMPIQFPRAATAAALLVLAAMPASAQFPVQIVPYGALEASGLGGGVALLGVGFGTGRAGWGPAASVTGLAVRIPLAGGGTTTELAVSPAIGIRYASATAATSLMGGYTFSDRDDDGAVGFSPTGGGSGPFATVQHDYWGTGQRMAQLIATYNFGAEYLWSRAKATQRIAPLSPFSVGGEVIAQGGGETGTDTYVVQLGPVLQIQSTPQLRFDLSGGVALRNNNLPASGYARLEFVFVPR